MAGNYMTNLLKHKISLPDRLFAGRPGNVKKYNFYTVSAACDIKAGHDALAESKVVILALKSLVSYPFSFPFGRNGNVRSALAMALRPVIGEHEDLLSLFPQITEQRSDITKGVAWFVSKSEIRELETVFGKDAVFWPAPVAFVSEIEGNGLVVWCDKSGCSAIWFEDYTPLFHRWMPSADGNEELLSESVMKYAESLGKTIPRIRVIKEETLSAPELQRCGTSALKLVRGLDVLDLSNKGTDNARQIEALFDACFNTVRILAAAGAVFVFFSFLLLVQNLIDRDLYSSAPSDIYRTAFGEESKNPLVSSKRKLRLLTGEGSQMTLEQTLSNFASAWQDTKAALTMKLDSMQYGTEQTEIQGIADSVNSIEGLRDSLSNNGFTAKLGEVQQVPGAGLRFSMVLTGVKK